MNGQTVRLWGIFSAFVTQLPSQPDIQSEAESITLPASFAVVPVLHPMPRRASEGAENPVDFRLPVPHIILRLALTIDNTPDFTRGGLHGSQQDYTPLCELIQQ